MKKRLLQQLLLALLITLLCCVAISCSSSNGKKYKISFDSDGGSFVAPITYVVGKELKMPTKPTKYGYEFQGWFLADGTKFDKDKTKISSPIKLKAKWEVGEYTITFDTDDILDVDPITAKYGDEIELPKLSALSGCEFMGWYKEDLNTPFTSQTMVGEDTVVYALWNAGVTTSTGTVKVDPNGNCYTTMRRTLAVFDNYQLTAGEYSVIIDYSSIKGAVGNNFGLVFALQEPTSASYWESGLGLSYYYFHIAIDVGAIQLAKVRGDHSLIYESKKIVMLEDNQTGWKEKYNSKDSISKFSVSWNNGKINCYIDDELQISIQDNSPILFGNKIGVRAVGAGLTFESTPTINPIYCARFDTDGAKEIQPSIANSSGRITLPENPVKEGYDFDCWKIVDGENYNDFNANEVLTSDITLKAFYKPKSYQIKLHRYLENPNDIDINGVIEQPYLSEVTLADPIREGKVFEGWYLEDGVTLANVDVMPLNGLDLYAKWSDDYVVTFDNDNGQDVYAQFVRENSVVVKPQNDPEKYGHIFKQWNIENEIYDFDLKVNKDFTLTASYEKGVFTYNFYALNTQNPNEIYESITLTFGEEIDIENPVREGLSFLGWYREDLITKVDVSTMLGENMDLYACYGTQGGADIHDIRGEYKKEIDAKTNQTIYRANKATSVGLFDGVSFTEGCISIEFDFSSWSPRAGFMFCATIPDGSLDNNWEMAQGVEYYTFNMDMGLGAFGLGKVSNGNYRTLDAVYLETNETSFRDKYLANYTKTKIIVSIKLEKIDNALKIIFYIDGEKQLEYLDSEPLTGNGVGISAYNSNTKFRDLVVIDVAPKLSKED